MVLSFRFGEQARRTDHSKKAEILTALRNNGLSDKKVNLKIENHISRQELSIFVRMFRAMRQKL